MKKKISCHIITYNQKEYISQCIEGVLMQKTNFSIEIIIGDDNSTDGTREILKEYARKYPDLIKFNLREVRGIGIPGKQNFLTTLELCTGEYISLCDGDDYWTDPLKLQKQVDFLEANPDYVLCFHQVSILKTNGEIVDDFITKVPENYETIETLARLGNYIHTPSVVFRNVIKDFPFEFQHTPIGDYFLYMMLAEHGKLKYLEEKMCVYRYGVGIFSGNSRLNMAKTNLKLFTCLLSYLKDDEIKKIIFDRQLYAVAHLEKILDELYNGCFVSNHIFFRAVKYTQTNLKNPSKILQKIIFKFKK
ncbi:glycosyltransferase family 2 protein [Flavobacterium sp. LS2P90]|uniref:Glycosyltransferase family 2 protein n=1 Tax=Flavobacterium xylosi TaxID=3230415 RepID=A0ABW6HSN7_9FLAO